jgi:hypothetical protein
MAQKNKLSRGCEENKLSRGCEENKLSRGCEENTFWSIFKIFSVL